MTPAARVQTAIEILDDVLSGTAAEQALTRWARQSRFAGSKDRAAIRDLVFDALRSRRSLAAIGGGETGRGLMLGLCRREGRDPGQVFTGDRYAPVALSAEESRVPDGVLTDPQRLDIPDWMWPAFQGSLGDRAEATAEALKRRAPVHLRVNRRKASPGDAMAALEREGIETVAHPASPMALHVTQGARKIRNASAYRDGLVELQDAASQAVVDALPLRDGMRVLDFCAGGGGKALAIATAADVTVFAHDAAPQRMRDLPARSQRAGTAIRCVTQGELRDLAPFDIVLTDVPCSGSGAWRRSPEGKWRLTPEQFESLLSTQAAILDETAPLIGAKGLLAYATCSMFQVENQGQIDRFLTRHPGWVSPWQKSWHVVDETDGFFSAHLTADG